MEEHKRPHSHSVKKSDKPIRKAVNEVDRLDNADQTQAEKNESQSPKMQMEKQTDQTDGYDLSNWVQFKLEGENPSRRAYHSSFIYEDYLYIHGGHDIREGCKDTLWRIDLNIRTKEPNWERIVCGKKHSPGRIAYHSLTRVGSKVYLIGGSTLGVDSKRDYVLDINSLEWKIIERTDKNAPVSIDEHTATLVEDKIYVFGGNIAGFKNDQIFVFDTKSHKWSKPNNTNGPCARSSHSQVLYNNKIYVFGGKDQDCNKLNDFWEYDTSSNKWKELIKGDDAPLSRSGHSACLYKNFMIIFGGIHELTQELNDMQAFDFNNGQWFSMIEENGSPTHSNIMAYGYSPTRKSFTKSVTAMSVQKNQGSNRNLNTRGESRNKEFSLSVQKTAMKNRSRKANQSHLSTNLTLSKLERLVRQKRKAQEQVHEETLLTSPTSLSMKNSFLIKTAGKAFDFYASHHKKKKFSTTNTQNQGDGSPTHYERVRGKLEGCMPKPRDGHTGLLYDERYLVIFGGDRHHMPFNDLFTLDLVKEI